MRYFYGNYHYSEEQITAFMQHNKKNLKTTDDYVEYLSDCLVLTVGVLVMLLAGYS